MGQITISLHGLSIFPTALDGIILKKVSLKTQRPPPPAGLFTLSKAFVQEHRSCQSRRRNPYLMLYLVLFYFISMIAPLIPLLSFPNGTVLFN